jgi:hypothetical protein
MHASNAACTPFDCDVSMARHVILNPYSIFKDRDTSCLAPLAICLRRPPNADPETKKAPQTGVVLRSLIGGRPDVYGDGYSVRDSSLGTRLPNPVAVATAVNSRAERSICLIMVLFIYVSGYGVVNGVFSTNLHASVIVALPTRAVRRPARSG